MQSILNKQTARRKLGDELYEYIRAKFKADRISLTANTPDQKDPHQIRVLVLRRHWKTTNGYYRTWENTGTLAFHRARHRNYLRNIQKCP